MFKFDNVICDIRFEKMNKINNADNTDRVRKPKNSSLMINFNENSGVDYLEINTESTRKDDIYLLL